MLARYGRHRRDIAEISPRCAPFRIGAPFSISRSSSLRVTSFWAANIVPRSCRDRSGIVPRSRRDRSGIVPRSRRDHAEIAPRSHLGVDQPWRAHRSPGWPCLDRSVAPGTRVLSTCPRSRPATWRNGNGCLMRQVRRGAARVPPECSAVSVPSSRSPGSGW